MAIKEPDVKLLWGRSGNRCAICRIELSLDAERSSASFPLGEQAHIVAREPKGPRGQSSLRPEERNSYHNLILLCPTHHTIIDKAEVDYTVDKLHNIKARHELWVSTTLSEGDERSSSADRLASAQVSIKNQDYTESLHHLRQAAAKERETPNYHFLCALTILARRSFNGISETERGQIARHLIRANIIDSTWRPTLLLMLLMDTDYCELHGVANDFGISARDLTECIRSTKPSPGQEHLLAHLPMSSRFKSLLRSIKGESLEID